MVTSEFYKSLPTKRMASGVLLFDSTERILIVKPNYKDKWEIPGGVVEKNESPKIAAEREIKEEIGLDKKISKILCVDYQDEQEIKTESLMFVFDGGKLNEQEIGNIKIDTKEISEFRFVNISQTRDFLKPALYKRIEQAIIAKESNQARYLENQVFTAQ